MLALLKKEYKTLLLISLLFLINIFFFWLKQGRIVVDTGREFYIPFQMLKGAVLYKDILNIFAPLSYQINALGFLIFGQRIETLYAMGVVNSYIILTALYFLSREFLNRLFSFLIVMCVMYFSVFSIDLYNYNMPYAYSAPYALCAFLISFLLLVKYIKNSKISYFYWCFFFAGLSISFKYEFVFYILFLIYAGCFLKHLKILDMLKCFICLAVMPVISFGILFLQGLNFHDCLYALLIIKKMFTSDILKYLYVNYSGTYFSLKIFINNFIQFLYLALLFVFLFSRSFLEAKFENRYAKIAVNIVYFAVVATSMIFLNIRAFAFLPIFNLLLLIIFFKQIYKDKFIFTLLSVSFLSSLKAFFSMNINNYGSFTVPVILLASVGAILYLSENLNSDFWKKALKESLLYILIATVFILPLIQYPKLKSKKYLINTPKGKIYAGSAVGQSYDELIDFIEKNTKKTDKIIIMPETPFINFMTNRDSDNFYFSLLPTYIEIFGESNIIKDFSKTRPEYFVLNNRNTVDYGYSYICEDYALDLCSYVHSNYDNVKSIKHGQHKMFVYRRKDLK